MEERLRLLLKKKDRKSERICMGQKEAKGSGTNE